MYCYIKDGRLVTTSPQFIPKRQEEITENILKTEKVEETYTDDEGKENTRTVEREYIETVVTQQFMDWLVYDEVLETELEGRVCYENGKIIAWEESEEKSKEDDEESKRTEAELEESKKGRPSEIIELLGKLTAQKSGMKALGEDTSEIDATMSALKEEYKNLKS